LDSASARQRSSVATLTPTSRETTSSGVGKAAACAALRELVRMVAAQPANAVPAAGYFFLRVEIQPGGGGWLVSEDEAEG
jgi:hypothetical protein